MTPGASQPLQIVLCEEESAGRIVVDLDSFVRFGGELDTMLRQFEARFPPLVRPQSVGRVTKRRHDHA